MKALEALSEIDEYENLVVKNCSVYENRAVFHSIYDNVFMPLRFFESLCLLTDNLLSLNLRFFVYNININSDILCRFPN